MSDEERKAIEWFKKDLMFWLIEGKDYVIIDNGEIPKMKLLLNLIEKQQKEIEKLNFENHMVKKWNEQLDKNSISKNKIIGKIKEIHNKGTFDAEIVLTKLLEGN